jgi:hypothetical protein
LVTAATSEKTSQNVKFLFEQVSDIHVPIKETWGSGFYMMLTLLQKIKKSFKTSL